MRKDDQEKLAGLVDVVAGEPDHNEEELNREVLIARKTFYTPHRMVAHVRTLSGSQSRYDLFLLAPILVTTLSLSISATMLPVLRTSRRRTS